MSSFDLDPFFLFSEPEPNPCIADLDPKASNEMERIFCAISPGHRRVGRALSPLSVLLPCSPAPDVIFSWRSRCLLSDKVCDVFARERLTGFSTKSATAKIRETGVRVDVSELVVTGWGGVAPISSGIREVEHCNGCGYLRYSGIEEPKALIDPVNWDGSDFFMIWPLPNYRFVTQRVVEACKAHGITGVSFERNMPLPSGRVLSGYSPGRLSYYMPADRAHALGDRLRIA